MNSVMKIVERLKKSAKFDRDFEDYDQALVSIREALEILRAEDRVMSEDPSLGNEKYRDQLRREFADFYGMAGGLYRRKAALGNREEMLRESEKMYREGLKREKDDSYNLTNSIVLPVLRDPTFLDRQTAEIHQALETVKKQVEGESGELGGVGKPGARKDQWWAWADLGLLNLLSGDLGSALRAYDKYREVGARAQDYESTILVLEELCQGLLEAQGSVRDSIQKAIEHLKLQKSRA